MKIKPLIIELRFISCSKAGEGTKNSPFVGWQKQAHPDEKSGCACCETGKFYSLASNFFILSFYLAGHT